MAGDQKPNRLMRALRFGRKTLPLLSTFVAPELLPFVQAAMSRMPGGQSAPDEAESRVVEQLRQSAEVHDQHQTELRVRLQEQAALAARLEAEMEGLRKLIERSMQRDTEERDELRRQVRKLESRVANLLVGCACVGVLALVALGVAVAWHR